MADGWIKLHRKIMESKTFSRLTAIQQLIAIYIILNANYKDGFWYDKYRNIEVPVKRGQLITSRNKIKSEWFKDDSDITDQKIRTTLKKLNSDFLTIEATKSYTLLTVLNYDTYQSFDEDDNQPSNQELTKSQPRANQELTTNNKDKKDKKVKKDNNTSLSLSETEPLFEEFWESYPRQIGKTKALKVWNARQKEKVDPNDLILAARNYAKTRQGKDKQYTQHPATFLGSSKPYEDYIKTQVNQSDVQIQVRDPAQAGKYDNFYL